VLEGGVASIAFVNGRSVAHIAGLVAGVAEITLPGVLVVVEDAWALPVDQFSKVGEVATKTVGGSSLVTGGAFIIACSTSGHVVVVKAIVAGAVVCGQVTRLHVVAGEAMVFVDFAGLADRTTLRTDIGEVLEVSALAGTNIGC
jgi:hypothetical protein